MASRKRAAAGRTHSLAGSRSGLDYPTRRSQKDRPPFQGVGFLAEAVGFEPTRAFTLPDFESGPL